MSDKTPGSEAAGSSGYQEPSVEGLESGVYESDAGEGYVWVRRDSTDEKVRAKMTGYPPDFDFEPGDETGIELVGGVWHTLPSVAHSVRLSTRIEWWAKNRRTGHLRFLAAHYFGSDPVHQASQPEDGGSR